MTSLFTDKTSWRTAEASRLAVIIDAADYFVALREAAMGAREAIYLVGWDFDLRIEMMPGESDDEGNAPDGMPNRLGDFLVALVKRTPTLELFMLKWDGAMLAAIGKQVLPTIWMQWMSGERVHFQLDSYHPAGACHHSKIVVIDDRVAFCGGIDATVDRWDTSDHTPDDPHRVQPNGEPFDPWHDATTVLEGEAARALGDLARLRWEKAAREELDPPKASSDPWPSSVEAGLENIEIAIARTAPRYHDDPLVNEIEELYLAIIRGAKKTLYMESQYLCAGSLCDAMAERLGEPDGPEIVVVNPQSAESFIEDEAMHSVRARMIEKLEAADATGDRFRVYHPVNAAGTPIYVHAKIVIADDRVLRIGSSNIDNRSMGFDTECDVAIEAGSDEERAFVTGLRTRLLAEHLGAEEDAVERAFSETGSLVATIERLNGGGEGERGLVEIEPEPLDPLEKALADTRLFDPRYRPKATERVKHAAKRGTEPYQLQAGTVGLGLAGLLGVAAVGIGGYLVWRRVGKRRRRLSAPYVITDRT